MKVLLSVIIVVILCFLMSNCTDKIDLTQDIEAIRKIEDERNNAFLSNDPKVKLAFESTHLSTVGWIEDGEFIKSKESLSHIDSMSILQMYDKTKWNERVELTPRIIKVSDDGTMAWVMSHEKFIGEYILKQGDEWKEQYFSEATLNVYEKKNGRWLLSVGSVSYKIPD